MNYENNIGLSFSSNYLKQGNNIEKCKISTKNHIPNISLIIREDKKNVDFKENKKIYNENIIYHIPSISYNLNNQKEIENIVTKIISS